MARKPTRRMRSAPVKLTVQEKISLTPRRRVRRQRRVGSRSAGGSGGFAVSRATMPPAAAGSIVGRAKPVIRSDDTGAIIVQNTELITDVGTSLTFLSAIIRIAPFSVPWLTGLASNYSKYKWISVRFIYIPSSSTTTSGSFAMGYQYDEPDVSPGSIAQMSMQLGFVACPTWAGWEGSCLLSKPLDKPGVGAVVATLDTDRLDKPWYPYINSGNYTTLVATPVVGPTVGDTYIPAVLNYAVQGGPASSVAGGQLYIQYEIALIEPIAAVLNF